MKLRFLYHIIFWVAFSALFVIQNPNATNQDYWSWFIILMIAAFVIYINLYILLPKYFFKKHYVKYLSLIIILISFSSFLLKTVVFSSNESLNSSFFQQFLNLFSLLIVTSSFKFIREYLRKQERVVKIENEQLKTELSLLKSQVNPHFLFNTLNNLYGLILKNKNDQAGKITLKLSDLMRYLLESSKAEMVSLASEIQFVNDYLALEKIRLSKKTDITFDISGINKDIQIPPLLFIPLIENAFKHGLQNLSEVGFAHFSLALQENELFFEAKNSVGKQNINQPKSETGLKNLRKRLALLYPKKHLLTIENKNDIFTATLHINL